MSPDAPRSDGAGLVFATPDLQKALGLARCYGGLRVLTGAPRSEGDELAPPAAVAALEEAGAEVVAVAVDGDRNTTRALLQSDAAAAQLIAWRGPPVMVFRPDAASAARLGDLGCRLVGADPRVARRLENKRAFRALCRRVGLPVVETTEMTWPPGADNRGVWGPYEGRAVVVQTPRGFAGKRTWLWKVGEDSPHIGRRLAGRPVLLAPLVDGPTWTVNAVVLTNGSTRVGAAMRQITGDPRLTDLSLSSCGAAIAPPGSEIIAEELAHLARAVGSEAAKAGFVGFFGVDAVGAPGALELIEMNARLTATLTVATLAEQAAGHRPLLLDHVAACLGLESEVTEESFSTGLAGLTGGHLLVRDASGWSADVPALGEYVLDEGHLRRIGSGSGWPSRGAFALWPAGADWGTPIEDRARLVFSDEMAAPDGSLSAPVEAVLSTLLHATG